MGASVDRHGQHGLDSQERGARDRTAVALKPAEELFPVVGGKPGEGLRPA